MTDPWYKNVVEDRLKLDYLTNLEKTLGKPAEGQDEVKRKQDLGRALSDASANAYVRNVYKEMEEIDKLAPGIGEGMKERLSGCIQNKKPFSFNMPDNALDYPMYNYDNIYYSDALLGTRNNLAQAGKEYLEAVKGNSKGDHTELKNKVEAEVEKYNKLYEFGLKHGYDKSLKTGFRKSIVTPEKAIYEAANKMNSNLTEDYKGDIVKLQNELVEKFVPKQENNVNEINNQPKKAAKVLNWF